MQMILEGSLLSAVQGVGQKSTLPYTMLEFSPVGASVFKLKANGHLNLPGDVLRVDRKWVLDVEPRSFNGQTSFTVLRISDGSANPKGK